MKTFLLLLLLLDSALGLSRPMPSRRDVIIQSTIATAATLGVGALPSNASYLDPTATKITQRVYLDVVLPTGMEGRITIGLFGDVMPRVVENFSRLCQQNSYAGTSFYRVLSGMSIQGGAIGADSNNGKTGTSASGAPFEPDNFNIKHTQEGLVSMVRGLSGSVDSRFFVSTVADTGWADDRYAAFGIVEDGMPLVHLIENLPVKPPQNNPKQPVKIVASGQL